MRKSVKWLAVSSFMTAVIFGVSGCGGPKQPTAATAKDVLPSELWTVYETTHDVAHEDNARELGTESFEVTKSQTDGKSSTVYVSAAFSDSAYRVTESLILYYSRYDSGSWELGSYDVEDYSLEIVAPENIELLMTEAQESAENHFDSDAVFAGTHFNEEEGEVHFAYTVNECEKENCTYSGTECVVFPYTISSYDPDGMGTDNGIQNEVKWDLLFNAERSIDTIDWHYDGVYASTAENNYFDVELDISKSSEGTPYLDAIVKHDDDKSSRASCYEFHGTPDEYDPNSYGGFMNFRTDTWKYGPSVTFEFTPYEYKRNDTYATYIVKIYEDKVQVGQKGYGGTSFNLDDAKMIDAWKTDSDSGTAAVHSEGIEGSFWYLDGEQHTVDAYGREDEDTWKDPVPELNESRTDSSGNEITGELIRAGVHWGGWEYVRRNVNGSYTTLTGELYLEKRDDPNAIQVKIYGDSSEEDASDGTLIYDSGLIDGSTEVTKISADISGCSNVTIVFDCPEEYYGDNYVSYSYAFLKDVKAE